MGQQVPEGWYADPQDPDPRAERWWNGHQWTAHTRRGGPVPAYGAVGPAFAVGPLTPDGARLGSRAVRLAAWLLDAVAVTIIATALRSLLAATTDLDPWDGMSSSWPRFQLDEWVGGLVVLATWVAWQWAFLARGGRTPGKVMAGLRVRPYDADGPLTHGMIARRIAVGATFFATGAVPYVGFLLGFLGIGDGLAMLTDDRRLSLHDRAAGTCVVVSQRSAPRSQPAG